MQQKRQVSRHKYQARKIPLRAVRIAPKHKGKNRGQNGDFYIDEFKYT